MEFNEKLLELRKGKGLTQEELAEKLFVSRAAVSKWESGRGYPNIDSLKAIAKYFSLSIDELLSGDELLCLAEEDNKQKETRTRTLIFGLLDLSVTMFLFLPIFAQRADGIVRAASLLSLRGVSLYLRIAFYLITGLTVLFGAASLLLHNSSSAFSPEKRFKFSLLLNALAVLVFIASLQPYAAGYLFVFFVIKLLMLAQFK